MSDVLLNIAPSRGHLPRETLDSPGGFAWWYVDMLDADGNGLVLIWSYGLPFLPGYTSAARAGRPEAPRMRPSINISVYEHGKLACYLLQELHPSDATWADDGTTWRFGDSTFRLTDRRGQRRLRVVLDCPIPASHDRLRGEVTLTGPSRLDSDDATWNGTHDWSPLMALARGSCDIAAGPERYRLEGDAYHDCNAGSATFANVGIAAWAWGRVPLAEEERIYYLLWDEAGALTARGVVIDDEGTLTERDLTVESLTHRRGLAGVRYPAELRLAGSDGLFLDVAAQAPVDDGPFYVRHFLRDRSGQLGMGEFCRPDRIDLPIHRPLVRMRVHRLDGKNSMWLPLFSGPRRGRIARLLRQWTP